MEGKMLLAPVLVVALAALGGGYWFMFMQPAGKHKKPAPPHVNGSLFTLAPEFVVNLSDGHYGKVTVALLLKTAPTAAQLNAQASVPTLAQDAVIRAAITNDLTGEPSATLVSRKRRNELVGRILKDLKGATDIPVTRVMFTDVVVQ